MDHESCMQSREAQHGYVTGLPTMRLPTRSCALVKRQCWSCQKDPKESCLGAPFALWRQVKSDGVFDCIEVILRTLDAGVHICFR